MNRVTGYILLMIGTAGCIAVTVDRAVAGDWPVACIFSFLAGNANAFAFSVLMDGRR